MFGANTLIYMNQSSPSLGFSLNYFTETTTNFQLRPLPDNLAMSMDCSYAVFVSAEQAAVTLKGGDIYILTLVPEGRGLKNILFEKAAAGVLPSCVSQQCATPPHCAAADTADMLLWSGSSVYWVKTRQLLTFGLHQETLH